MATKRSASRSSRRDQRAGRFGSGLWCEKLIALPKAFCDTASVEFPRLAEFSSKASTTRTANLKQRWTARLPMRAGPQDAAGMLSLVRLAESF